jgi:hypothetical protein
MFNSDARQDEFVANMLQFKKDGYYVDIGACHSINSNNTFFFDSLNWKGICVEIESQYNDSYNFRKNCVYLNQDATKIDFEVLFRENNFPSTIDYISLDIDTQSLYVLSELPLSKYNFRVITIEHDYYLYGDKYKKAQRTILEQFGYTLICSDVYVQQPGFNRENCSFEDWWIKSNEFDNELITKIKSNSEYPSEIIKKFIK